MTGITRIAVLLFFSALASDVVAQHIADDNKIAQIESMKKMEVERFPATMISEMNKKYADTTIRVLEVVNSSSRTTGAGKTMQRTRYQGTEIRRTCYFDDQAKLFAIKDSVWYSDHSKRVLTHYYDGKNHFTSVDEQRKDVTATVDRNELYDWLASMFSLDDLKFWGLSR